MAEGISNVGASLIAIFAFLLVVLAADCAYVIWRRRRFRRRSSLSSAAVSSAGAGDSSAYVLSSKELLYFFCWENQSRIEPNDQVSSIDGPDRSGDRRRDIENSAPEVIGDDDVLKLHEEAYGPSRLLFTIKEEEEATDGQDRLDRDDDHADDDGDDDQEINTTNVERESGGDDVVEKDVFLTVVSDDEATPFSTPCSSPPYYTPSPSPSREELKRAYESYAESESSEEFSFAILEII